MGLPAEVTRMMRRTAWMDARLATVRALLKRNAALRITAEIVREVAAAISSKRTTQYQMKFPPGHYYSPIPSLKEVEARAERLFATPSALPGINLRDAEQLQLIAELSEFSSEFNFPMRPQAGSRYHFDNPYFSYGDAALLYSFLVYLRPSRVIEVGSGFSSALMLEVRDRFLDGETHFTFIEPYTERLDELLTAQDQRHTEIIRRPVQDVDPAIFGHLKRGDILFVDSSHVSKVGSDVNFLIFEALPLLKPGVVVHFHDVFYPFEYPKAWILEGRAWNEGYLLRAFLMHNDEYRILAFNSYLSAFHADEVSRALPFWEKNPGGSLWLERGPRVRT